MANTPVTPQAPFFDDYDAEKGFYRILFRPSYPVQARELTQMQTMLQEQVGRFADHIFENGTVVIPGDVKYDTEYAYIQLTTAPGSSPKSYIGKTIARIGNTLTATIENYAEAEDSDPFTFFVKYNSADSSNQDSTFSPGETLIIDSSENVTIAAAATAIGVGSACHVKSGIYYYNSLFVLVEDQTVILQKYDVSPTATVGLLFEQEIITPENDISLLDNASGTTNYTAPGAYRLKFTPRLVKASDLADLTNFVQLLVVENGYVKEEARNTEYSVIEQTLARRTYDESGDYTVDPFLLTVREHLNTGSNNGVFTAAQGGDATKLVYELDPGKAYVRGYEVETISNVVLTADKARETASVENAFIYQPLGSYFLAQADTPNKAGISFSGDYPKVSIRNNGGTEIGTANVRYIKHEDSTTYRIYVFNVSMTGAFSVSGNRITSTGSGTHAFDMLLASTQLQETSNKVTVYQLPFGVISNVSSIVYDKIKQLGGSVSGNQVTINSGLGTGEALFDANPDDYIVIDANNQIYYATNAVLPVLTLNGTPTAPVTILAPVRKTGGSQKTKTLLTTTASGSSSAGSISLGKADIFQVTAITGMPGNVNLLDYYTIDNGQRDNLYDLGRIVKNNNFAIPSGVTTVNITFSYFNHGSGDFFVRGSYPNTVAYEDIPVFSSSDGRDFPLANCIDYRPRMNDAGTGFTGSGASFNDSVFPNGSAFFDFEYYLKRIDKIVLAQDGTFSVINGTPSSDPIEPSDKENSISLYTITLNPYTFSADDTSATAVEHKRYTMADIAKLEQRIDNLEYYTSLSLLEKDTANTTVIDENGLELFKSGFVVDPFSGHNVGDTQNDDYHISMDLENSEARPESTTVAVDLALNAAASSGTYVFHEEANVITLPYNSIPAVTQAMGSKLERLNPFSVYDWTGIMTLTPESDFWYSRTRVPYILNNKSGIFDAIKYPADDATDSNIGMIWNNWKTLWAGSLTTSLTDLISSNSSSAAEARWKDVRSVRETTVRADSQSQLSENRTGTRVNALSRMTLRTIGNKTVSASVIPYIRSRVVTFVAKALKPTARVYPFFDGRDVSLYCKPQGGSYGDPLITDASGNITGLFSIPNNDAIHFRTGDRVFKLTDSSVNDDNASTTQASATYAASGLLKTREAAFFSVRQADAVRDTNVSGSSAADSSASDSVAAQVVSSSATNRNAIIGWQDPIAQSFLVDTPGGVFLTSVTLFFGPASQIDSHPVVLQIRNMENGFPGTKIIPMSNVVLPASQINSYNSAATVPADRFVGTKFTFDAPIFLQENTEYCFVVMSNSPVRSIWASEMGQVDVITNQKITKQPYSGVMFKAQKGTTWIKDDVSDLKFVLERASFDSSSTATLRFDNTVEATDVGTESDPFTRYLDNNPFHFEEPSSGVALVTVSHQNHGMVNGDLVSFTGPSGTINGIPSSNIFGNTFTITAATQDSYQFQFTYSGGTLIPGFGGGTGISATSKVSYSVAHFAAQQIVSTGSSINWSFKGVNKGGSSLDSVATAVLINETQDLQVTKSIGSSTDQSVQLTAVLSTNIENVSPMIDVERVNLLATQNRINAIDDTTILGETAASGGPAIARYITRPITLTSAANRISVYIDINRPQNTLVKAYAKILPSGSDQAFEDQTWTEMAIDGTTPGETSDTSSFSEYRWLLSGLDSFTQFAVKVVLYVNGAVTDQSALTARVPRMRDLRAIASVE